MVKTKYGGASAVKVYENQESDIEVSDALKKDIKLFEEKLGFCFKYYASPLWKIGNTEIIESLENNKEKNKIFDRIVEEFPTIFLEKNEIFYRIRVNTEDPFNENQYDSSPKSDGRLNPENESVLYASKNLEICIYECRVTIEDEIYVSMLEPVNKLKVLDLTEPIPDDECDDFKSLYLSIQMLFLSGKHSYDILRELRFYIKKLNFDGILYPSYFSLIKTGKNLLPDFLGLSIRNVYRNEEYTEIEKNRIIKNIALFGNPIKEKK